MSKRGSWLSFNSFSGGEKSDLPPHMIPDDSLLKAVNVLTDRTGRLAKRGPVQNYLTSASSAIQLQQVGLNKLTLGNLISANGFGVSSLGYHTFDLPTPPAVPRAGSISAQKSLSNLVQSFALTQANWGPSFNSFGIPFFPLYSTSPSAFNPFAAFAGSADTVSYLNSTASITITAHNRTIAITAGPTFVSTDKGKFVYLADNNAGYPNTTKEYIGVITNVSSSTTIEVYPAPSQSWNTVSTGLGVVQVSPFWGVSGKLFESGGALDVPAGTTFGCVHQNRVVVLCSSTTTFSGSVLSTPALTPNNTVSWSSITGESATAANTGSDGLLALLYSGWPKSQQISLDTARVTGLVSLDANNLLVLCSDKTLLISGNLGTIVPAGSIDTSSFNVRTVSAEVGCVDRESIQRTPLGVMFAGRDGVYITDGNSFRNTMADKIQRKWTVYDGKNIIVPTIADYNKVVGSAVLGDTHYVVFTRQGPHFICDLYNDFSWTEIQFEPCVYIDQTPGGPFTNEPLFGVGVRDTAGAKEVYAPRLNQPVGQSGQLIRPDAVVLLDSILETEDTITTSAQSFNQLRDATTDTAFNATIQTKSFALSDPTQLKAYKTAMLAYSADARVAAADPVEFRYGESLQPDINFASAAYTTLPSTTASGTNSKNKRVSLVPRPIDSGLSIGITTDYEASVLSPSTNDATTGDGQFRLYELGLNAVGLREGRTVQ